MTEQRNWAGNTTYRAARLHFPETREQVQDLVRRCRKIKALGTRHSFNSIADTTEDQISLTHFTPDVTINRERHSVTVNAGIKYGVLCEALQQQGFALHNLASLPHISVAGACATATHGSGVTNANLSAAVSEMEMVLADGSVQTFSRERNGEEFAGMVVGLGGLGIVTKLTLDIVPTFDIRQDVYENLSWTQLEVNFDAIISSAYSVSLFTDWRGANINQVWIKSRVLDEDRGSEWFGATRAVQQLHPLAGMPPENCTQQLGVLGPWHERLPHFRLAFTPSSGEELQTEYLLPREHAPAALHSLAILSEQIAPLLQISEIRTVAADALWMSPCYKQDCVAIHFTWMQDQPAVEALLPVIEDCLAPFHARPHWGKLFTMPPARLQSLYPKIGDFCQHLETYDPESKFRNAFLDTYLFEAR